MGMQQGFIAYAVLLLTFRHVLGAVKSLYISEKYLVFICQITVSSFMMC